MTITGIINLPISILNFNIEVVIGSRRQLMEYKWLTSFPVLSPNWGQMCRGPESAGFVDVPMCCEPSILDLIAWTRSPRLRWLPHPSHRDNEEPGPIWHQGDKFRLLSLRPSSSSVFVPVTRVWDQTFHGLSPHTRYSSAYSGLVRDQYFSRTQMSIE